MSKIDNVKEKFSRGYHKTIDFCEDHADAIYGGFLIASAAVMSTMFAYGVGKIKGAAEVEKAIAKTAPEAYKEICAKLSAKQAAEYIAKLK